MDKKTVNIYRFAPSPTGVLHVGGARTAIFNWLLARGCGGKFLIRIEDTDQKRSTQASIDQILNSLSWLNLDWDAPPVFQSEHARQYQRVAMKLLAEGKAYRCFCSAEWLQEERRKAERQKNAFLYNGQCDQLDKTEVERRLNNGEPFVVRLRIGEGITTFNDHIRGQVAVRHEELDDFVVLRSDGTAVYHLAVVVDDHNMGITHVVRGDDHLSNTPKQILIHRALNWPIPEYAHVPLIHGSDGGRLSKRHGASSVEEFKESGYLSEAVFNYLCLLGWSPKDETEIFDRDELMRLFSLERVNKKNAVFDEKKLKWMNGKYISLKQAGMLVSLLEPYLQKEEKQYIENHRDAFYQLIDLVKTRAQSLPEIYDACTFFFRDPHTYEAAGVEKYFSGETALPYLQALKSALETLHRYELEPLEAAIRSLAADLDIKAGVLIHPLRLAITGRTVSPGIFDVIYLLGRETVLRRLDQAIQFIGTNS